MKNVKFCIPVILCIFLVVLIWIYRDELSILSGAEFVNFWKSASGIVLTGLAILTYLRARMTILSPILTETFRMQAKLLDQVHERVAYSYDFELKEDYAIEEMLVLNWRTLLHTFTFFHPECQADLPDDLQEIIGTSQSTYVFNSEDFRKKVMEQRKECGMSPLVPGREKNHETYDWSNDLYIDIQLPLKFEKKYEEITRLATHPLMPQRIAAALHKLGDDMRGSCEAAALALRVFSPSMLDLFLTKKRKPPADHCPSEVRKVFDSIAPNLFMDTHDILLELRSHYATDEIERLKM